ncbi:hypothetical protein [Polaribacter dokdonensis]|uniref:Uncharacterized protein n=1 Tax=Polaribacter dokdonensis DSW-5 TaxID=1300348 RepID=A0A0M9CEF0_9FLAO|nr:hypothetical protein [Polaribacter dokdonensis]KOY50862.1 hypothetical protein I602_422 [Polaribacter dokdonensis DSW-5]SEE24259.1 hypothetical protein SAMN05444353_1363 [Polaribacter dokdonensis DSW-5]
MNRKYLNIFWAFLGIIIILNEFVIGKIEFVALSQIKFGSWVFILLWSTIAIKNLYSYFSGKTTVANKK